MSENFGFESVTEITTQTYSRTKPKKSTRLVELKWEDISHLVEEGFSNYNYFYHTQTAKPPIYGIKDENGKILAAAKVSIANWEIKRLPGKMGGILTKMIPYIPVINKLIRPKSHRFIVPEAVFAINNDSELVEELFDGILQKENLNVIIRWIDVKDHLYRSLRSEVKWGLLDKLVGASKAHVVQKWNPNKEREYDNSKPVFTAGFDFI